MWRGISRVVPRLGRRASTSPVSPCAARGRGAGRWLRRLRQAQPAAPAARADRSAGRLPVGRRQDPERPRLHGRRSGPGAGAERLAAAQGGQSLRLRALRHRAQADHRRRGGALHRALGRVGRARALRRALGVAGRQAAVPERDGGQGLQRRQVGLRRRRALQAQRQAGRRGDRQARRAPAGDQRLQRQRRLRRRRRSARLPATRAISVHTQTLTDVGGDAAQLDTRRPVRQGPAPDRPRRRARQAARRHHLRDARCCAPAACAARWSTSSSRSRRARPRASPSSIRRSTRTTRSTRACARRWRPGVCASEPWTFVIDRSGKISTRFEGAFSVGELQRAVAKVA